MILDDGRLDRVERLLGLAAFSEQPVVVYDDVYEDYVQYQSEAKS